MALWKLIFSTSNSPWRAMYSVEITFVWILKQKNVSAPSKFAVLSRYAFYPVMCKKFVPICVFFSSDYLQHIADALLYKLLLEADFSCTPLRFLTREILTEVILLPLISLVSDPDYVNQTIIWLVRAILLFFWYFESILLIDTILLNYVFIYSFTVQWFSCVEWDFSYCLENHEQCWRIIRYKIEYQKRNYVSGKCKKYLSEWSCWIS